MTQEQHFQDEDQIVEAAHITHKKCRHCKESKPLTDFIRRSGKQSGVHSRRGTCRICRQLLKAETPKVGAANSEEKATDSNNVVKQRRRRRRGRKAPGMSGTAATAGAVSSSVAGIHEQDRGAAETISASAPSAVGARLAVGDTGTKTQPETAAVLSSAAACADIGGSNTTAEPGPALKQPAGADQPATGVPGPPKRRRRRRRRSKAATTGVNSGTAAAMLTADAAGADGRGLTGFAPAQSDTAARPAADAVATVALVAPGSASSSAPGTVPALLADAGQPAAGEPDAPPKRRRRRRRRRKAAGKSRTAAPEAGAEEALLRPRRLIRRQMPPPPPKPKGPDASVLRLNRQGYIRMRGITDKGRRWHQETDLETAATLVREYAAIVVNRHTILRLYSNKSFRSYILTRDKYTCHFCGEYGDTIDHVLPRVKGGHTTPINCVCACNLCNQSKASLSLDEFLSDADE